MKTKARSVKKEKVAAPAVKKAEAVKPVIEKPADAPAVEKIPETVLSVPEKPAVAVLRKYRTISRQTGISPGLLIGLSADQYAARRNELTIVSDGIYRTKAALVFMKGEVISLLEVSPGLAVNLEAVLDE